MLTQTDPRFTFDIFGGEATNAFKLAEFEFDQVLRKPVHLSVALSNVDAAVDIGRALDHPARLIIWHSGVPAQQTSEDCVELAR